MSFSRIARAAPKGEVDGGADHDGADERLTPAEAAELLGIGKSAVRARIRAGTLPAEKDGRVWRIPLEAVLEPGGSPLYAVLRVMTDELIREVGAFLRTERLDGDYVDELWRQIGDLREDLGGERVRREAAEAEVERLRVELEHSRAETE